MRKILFISLVIFSIIYILIQFNACSNAKDETKEICLENRYKILNKEMTLQLQLIGQKIFLNQNSRTYKIVISEVGNNNLGYDFERDIQSAMEYYIEKKADTLWLADVKIVYISKSGSTSIMNFVSKQYVDKILIIPDSTNYISRQLLLPNRGVVVLLLNECNICLYGFYLEQNNDRKIFENSPIIFNLIKNLK